MTRKEAMRVSNLARFANPNTEIGKTYLELCEIRKQISDYVVSAIE